MARKFQMQETEIETLAEILQGSGTLDSDDMIGIARRFFDRLPDDRKIEIQGQLLNTKQQKEIRRTIAESLRNQFEAEGLYTARELGQGDLTRLTTYLTTEAHNLALQEREAFNNEDARIEAEEKPNYVARHIIQELPEATREELTPRLEGTNSEDDLEALLADSTPLVTRVIQQAQEETRTRVAGIIEGTELTAIDPATIEDADMRGRYNINAHEILMRNTSDFLLYGVDRPSTCCTNCMRGYEDGLNWDLMGVLEIINPDEHPYQIGDKVKVKPKKRGKKRDATILRRDQNDGEYLVRYDGHDERWVTEDQLLDLEEGEFRKIVAELGMDRKKIAERLISDARAEAAGEFRDEMADAATTEFQDKYSTDLDAEEIDPATYLASLRERAESEFQDDKRRRLSTLRDKFQNKFIANPDDSEKEIHNSIESIVEGQVSEEMLSETWEEIKEGVTSNGEQSKLLKKERRLWGRPHYKVNAKGISDVMAKAEERRLQEFREVILPQFVNEQLAQDGVNPIAWDGVTYAYVVDPENAEVPEGARILDPFRIGEEYLADLMTIMGDNVKGAKQEDKLAIARELILNGQIPSMDELRKTLTKPSKKLLKQILDAAEGEQTLTTGSRAFNVFGRDDPRNADVAALQARARALGTDAQYIAARDLLVFDLLQTFQQNGDRARQRDFEIVWQRYNPDFFDIRGDLRKDTVFTFEAERNVARLMEGKRASGACTNDQGLRDHSIDLGAIYLVHRQNGSATGFSRLYYMLDKDGTPFLSTDTHEGGGLIARNTAGLAEIQMALDTNVKALIGADYVGRDLIKEGFSNHAKKYRCKKVGTLPRDLNFPGYQLKGDGTFKEKDQYTLIHNWRRE